MMDWEAVVADREGGWQVEVFSAPIQDEDAADALARHTALLLNGETPPIVLKPNNVPTEPGWYGLWRRETTATPQGVMYGRLEEPEVVLVQIAPYLRRDTRYLVFRQAGLETTHDVMAWSDALWSDRIEMAVEA